MLQEKTRYKPIAIAAVMAFILAHIKAYVLSGTPDDGMSYTHALIIYFSVYFILTYTLTLIVLHFFSDKPPD